RDGHYRSAINTAAETLTGQVRGITGRFDPQAAAVWSAALSDHPPQPGKPRLRYPGPDNDLTVRSIREGLRQYAAGVNALIRNTSTHGLTEPPRAEAIEQLAA